MARILRAEPGWQDSVARALGDVPRPIAVNERLLPCDGAGVSNRNRYDRSRLPPARPAATLLAIYPDAAGRLVVPLTVRRDEMRSHAGEVSLPGGAIDAGDAGPEAAALREAHEELGIDPRLVTLAGTLEPIWIPVSNYELQPVVGTLAVRPDLVPHDVEVAGIVELPLEALYDEALLGIERFESRGVVLHAAAYRYGGVRAWGATAITLGMLAAVLDL